MVNLCNKKKKTCFTLVEFTSQISKMINAMTSAFPKMTKCDASNLNSNIIS